MAESAAERIECSIGCGNSFEEEMSLGWVHFHHIAAGADATRPGQAAPEMYVCPACMGGADEQTWRRGYLEAARKAQEATGAEAFRRQRRIEDAGKGRGEGPQEQAG